MDQGELSLSFDEAKHEYRFAGRTVPSVTQVLAPLSDLSMVPRDVLERKAALGTAVHRACELINKGTLDYDRLHPAIVPYVDQYLRFLEFSGFDPVLSERRVYSKRYRFAGTLDLWGQLHGKNALIDIKTVVSIYPASGPQTAAYEIGLQEQDGLTTDERYILRLATDHYRLEPMTKPDDKSVFLAALTIHNWKQRHDIKN